MANVDKAQDKATYRIGLEPRRDEFASERAHHPQMQIQGTSLLTGILYATVLLASVVPFGYSGWVTLAVGADSLAGPESIFLDTRCLSRGSSPRPATLDTPSMNGWLTWCRRLGMGLLVVGFTLSASRVLVRPLGHLLAPRGTDNGIEFFIVGLAIKILATLAPMGLLLFEFSRLGSFEESSERRCEAPRRRISMTQTPKCATIRAFPIVRAVSLPY